MPIGAFTFSASAETATSGTTGDCTWTLNGTVLTISGNGDMENYNNYSNPSPWGTDITEVIIENGVTSIGSYAFYACTSLKSITIPSGLKAFGNNAFYRCNSLPGIVIPDGVTSIGSEAFYNCSKISEIIIPDSVISIGKNAFTICSFTSITIPKSVISIGTGAFSYCPLLTSIEVNEDNSTYYSVNNCIIKKSTNALVAGCNSSVIPDGVTSIEDEAFSGCSSRVNITIPDSVTRIGASAFSGSNFTSITMPKSVTYIADGAFYLCSYLTNVYYSGNRVDKGKINIGGSNQKLINANWHYSPCENDAHIYNYDCTTICKNCDYIRTVDTVHMFDNDCDEVCNVCGEHRIAKHIFEQLGENTATCKVCNISKSFDFIINTDETITLSYEASKEFDFAIENTSIAKIVNVSSSVVSMGSYYKKVSSAKISPVYLGETTVNVIDPNGVVLASSTLLVVEGEHQTQLAEVITPATCTDNGTGTYRCKFCDYEEQGVIYAPVHIEVIDTYVAPTCTQTGLTEGKHCSRCNEVFVAQETIPATGHTWENETPDENNNLQYECSVCHDTLVKINIKNANVEVDEEAFQYHLTFPNLPVSYSGKELVLNEDYELIYTLGEKTYQQLPSRHMYIWDLGTCTITVRGINNYFGEVIFNVDIRKFDMSNAHLMTTWTYEGNGSYGSSSYDMKSFEYDGTAKMQSGYRVCDDNDTISAENYEITYRNNVEVGMAMMIITGKGDYYTGTLEKEFSIYPRAISSVEISKLPNKVTYKKGDEKIDVTGGKITIRYQNGETETINMTADMLDGDYNLSMVGSQNVWLNCQNYALYFEITVIENRWVLDSGKWYYYENDQLVKNTWVCDSVGWCYLGADGSWVTSTGWEQVNGYWYYLNNGYRVENDWRLDSTGWCFLDGEGKWVKNCFVQDSVGLAYITEDGYFYYNVTGWKIVNNEWYYVENGYAVKDEWRADSVGWCYLSETGAMVTNGFVADSVGLAYITANGYFYYTETGWRFVDNKWYFVENGYAITNCWKQDSIGWCYLNSNGSMTKSDWVYDGGCWYYLDANGYMVTGTHTINGTVYTFNSSGVWVG